MIPQNEGFFKESRHHVWKSRCAMPPPHTTPCRRLCVEHFRRTELSFVFQRNTWSKSVLLKKGEPLEKTKRCPNFVPLNHLISKNIFNLFFSVPLTILRFELSWLQKRTIFKISCRISSIALLILQEILQIFPFFDVTKVRNAGLVVVAW